MLSINVHVVRPQNPAIFSKAALAGRKRGMSASADKWPNDYLRDVHPPTPVDFRRLRKHVARRRKIYESNYRDLRHKVFAHNVCSDTREVEALFAKTNVRELQQLLIFLLRLYEALWQLFYNGRKPALRPMRYSIKRIRKLPAPASRIVAVQERLIRETEEFLKSLVGESS